MRWDLKDRVSISGELGLSAAKIKVPSRRCLRIRYCSLQCRKFFTDLLLQACICYVCLKSVFIEKERES